jgi:hypothetical protein
MPQYIINVVHGRKGGKKVRPGKLTVEGSEEITWKNNLSLDVHLTFPQGDRILSGFPGTESTKPSVRLPAYTILIPAGGSESFTVLPDPLHGDHSYQVQDTEGGFYSGDSDPRIDVL